MLSPENNIQLETTPNKFILISLFFISILVLAIFYFPNSVASENISMVQMFEPDEAAPFSYLMRMIAPVDGVEQTLRNFVFYEYYYYGFPHFALSAISILPLRWIGQLENIQLIFLILRLSISIIPMMLGLLLLAYMQDGFRTYRSVVLYCFLLAIPAVVSNNYWWHPDGLCVLFSTLVIYLIWKDSLRFGWNFFLAAVINGILIATKLVGLYFFLAVGLALILGFIDKKIGFRKLIGRAISYIGVMAVSFVAANPFLLSGWARTAYRNIFFKQTELLSEGYGIVYEKGLSAFWSIAKESYGTWFFILTVLGLSIWGVFKGQKKYLFGLILAWFFPLTFSLIFVTHFKFQYWLPVALPLFSCIAIAMPEQSKAKDFHRIPLLLCYGSMIILVIQFSLFLFQDVRSIIERTKRAENNERIMFYSIVVDKLEPIHEQPLLVYYDYRLYLPETPGWEIETTHDLLDYNYINEEHFDVLLLLDQRIRDYTNPNAIGIDTEQFTEYVNFYSDAKNEAIKGFDYLFRNDVGLIFVKSGLLTP